MREKYRQYDPDRLSHVLSMYEIKPFQLSQETGIDLSYLLRIIAGKHHAKNQKALSKIIKVLEKRGIEGLDSILIPTVVLPKQKPRPKKETIMDQITQKFFSVKANPFRGGDIDQEKLYQNQSNQNLKQIIINAAITDDFLVVTGVTGVGKSTMLESALAWLREEEPKLHIIEISAIDPERVNTSYLIRQIIRQLGKVKIPTRIDDQEQLLSQILLKIKKNGGKIALFIDEAHCLSPKTLILLKKLWVTLGTKTVRMAVILVGQPSLSYVLDLQKLTEVNERVGIIDYNPLLTQGAVDFQQVKAYIQHKLTVEGGEMVFTDDAVEAIIQRKINTPQKINQICIACMQRAAQIQEGTISAEIVAMV